MHFYSIAQEQFHVELFLPMPQVLCPLSGHAICDCDSVAMNAMELNVEIPLRFRGLGMPCGHYTSTSHALNHFILNALNCPICKNGFEMPVAVESLPVEWREAVCRRYIKMGRDLITSIAQEVPEVVVMMLSELLLFVNIRFNYMSTLLRTGLLLRSIVKFTRRLATLIYTTTDAAAMAWASQSDPSNVDVDVTFFVLRYFEDGHQNIDCCLDADTRKSNDKYSISWFFGHVVLPIEGISYNQTLWVPMAYFVSCTESIIVASTVSRIDFDFFWKDSQVPFTTVNSEDENEDHYIDLAVLRKDIHREMCARAPTLFFSCSTYD